VPEIGLTVAHLLATGASGTLIVPYAPWAPWLPAIMCGRNWAPFVTGLFRLGSPLDCLRTPRDHARDFHHCEKIALLLSGRSVPRGSWRRNCVTGIHTAPLKWPRGALPSHGHIRSLNRLHGRSSTISSCVTWARPAIQPTSRVQSTWPGDSYTSAIRPWFELAATQSFGALLADPVRFAC
jgi:hypothetical protein